MAGTPIFKVYDAHGDYQASVKEPEAGAALMSFYGDGAEIRIGHHHALWVEGSEGQPASESFDHVADVCAMRLEIKRARGLFKRAQQEETR